jgi:transcriptional regulator with XRE-family HTH domain
MKRVDDYIKRKIKNKKNFENEYTWIMQKANIVAKIIEYRNKHNLTQAQLAKSVGVTQQYISKIEEGEFSGLPTVEKLLHKLGYGVKVQIISIKGKFFSKELIKG